MRDPWQGLPRFLFRLSMFLVGLTAYHWWFGHGVRAALFAVLAALVLLAARTLVRSRVLHQERQRILRESYDIWRGPHD